MLLASAVALTACSGDDPAYPLEPLPAPKSALLAPDTTSPCPITQSSIQSLTTRGTGTAFNGASFGSAGTYKYILAEATGVVKASDPCAPMIVDLRNAADASGNVTYKFDVLVLTPSDSTKASGSLLYIVNNRSNSSALEALNDGSGSAHARNGARGGRGRRCRFPDEAGHDGGDDRLAG
ncbi:MAG: hypothetical protein EBS99_03550 [Betaproteobacteria bacterium]|nr:hypothetical protein [Betaproteobacteria bacterium]